MAQPCPRPASHDRPAPERRSLPSAFVLMLVIGITAAFLWMVWAFVMTVVLAAILAGLFHPLYRRLNALTGERGWLAALVTVLVVLVVIVVPLALVLGLVAGEAVRLSTAVAPAAPGSRRAPQPAADAAREAPLLRTHRACRTQILARAGELIGNLGRFAVTSISATTAGTASAILQFFILLYAVLPVDRRAGAAAQDHQLPAAARGEKSWSSTSSSR